MRYIILIILCLPVILLALTNILTQYKLNKISKSRFRKQIALWLIILAVLISSFPVYNLITGAPLLDSNKFSSFDILQTTAIIYLLYALNNQRAKVEKTERTIREMHQEISIILSTKTKS